MSKIVIIGGGLSGLAAADKARQEFSDVVLIDNQGFDDSSQREGAWGEFIHNYERFPRGREAGGINRFFDKAQLLKIEDEGFQSRMGFETPDPAVIDRSKFEVEWARELADEVKIKGNENVSEYDYLELARNSDRIVDATGPDPISARVVDKVSGCGKSIITLSASMKGDFSDFYPRPAVVTRSNGTGYITTKSNSEATLGLGWYHGYEPEEPLRLFEKYCRSLGVDKPRKEAIRVGREPTQDSRNFEECAFEIEGCEVRLSGDACGLVNGVNNFGNVRAGLSGQKAVLCSSESYIKWLETETKITNRQQFFARARETIGSDTLIAIMGSDGQVLNEAEFCEPSSNLQILRNIANFGKSAIKELTKSRL